VFAIAVLLFAHSSLPAAAAHPPVTGHWEGVVHRGSSQLAIRLDLGDGAPNRNFFSAPDLGAIDIPLSHVRLGRALHAELVGDVTTTVIDATVTGDVMTGTFRETQARGGTFRLHRVSASVAEPYLTQAVTFANGDVRLAGTVYAPRSSGKHPAVVLVQGSGPEGRWATAYIADALARRGIVALSYDKRGVGASGGDWRTATFDDLAADARAGVHLLAQRPDVDATRLGVYGHSQGGYLAPMIAENDPEVTWIGDADGNVGPQYRQDLFRVNTALAKRYSGQTLADAEKLYAEFVDTARNGTPHARLRTDMAEAGDPDWLDLLAIPDDDSWIWPWYAKTGNDDNSRAWGTVHVPCSSCSERTTRSLSRANRSPRPSSSSKSTATRT
jgi:hypothetical protein